jgi:Chemotaxis protein; stimulates methylation of MCP proteins
MAVILVGMADLKAVQGQNSLTTLGLGSCVGVCFHDAARQIAGMAHIMLPDSTSIGGNRMKFADTGIVDLLNLMARMGSQKGGLTAKLAGGAHMFGTAMPGSVLNVGERNVEACIRLIQHFSIPLVSKDVGGQHGRTIVLDAVTGSLRIKTVGYGESVI